MSVTEL